MVRSLKIALLCMNNANILCGKEFFFCHRKKKLLFMPCNMAVVQNLRQRNQSYVTTLLKLVESRKWETDIYNFVRILSTDMSNKKFETCNTS